MNILVVSTIRHNEQEVWGRGNCQPHPKGIQEYSFQKFLSWLSGDEPD